VVVTTFCAAPRPFARATNRLVAITLFGASFHAGPGPGRPVPVPVPPAAHQSHPQPAAPSTAPSPSTSSNSSTTSSAPARPQPAPQPHRPPCPSGPRRRRRPCQRHGHRPQPASRPAPRTPWLSQPRAPDPMPLSLSWPRVTRVSPMAAGAAGQTGRSHSLPIVTISPTRLRITVKDLGFVKDLGDWGAPDSSGSPKLRPRPAGHLRNRRRGHVIRSRSTDRSTLSGIGTRPHECDIHGVGRGEGWTVNEAGVVIGVSGMGVNEPGWHRGLTRRSPGLVRPLGRRGAWVSGVPSGFWGLGVPEVPSGFWRVHAVSGL
jgi:hypothetical protein